MCAAKIKDGLFIGDEETSKDPEFLDLNKISNLVNVAGREVNNAWSSHGLVYLTYNWEDRSDYNLFDRKGGEELIIDLIEFIDTSLRHGVSVLIFSKRGVGRAAVAATVYLMCKYHWGFEKTFAFISARKVDVELNDGFIRQLLTLDKRIRSCCQQLLQQQLQLLNSYSLHNAESNNDRLYEAIEVMRWKDWDAKYLDMEKQLLQMYLRNNPSVSIAQLTKSLPIPNSSPMNGKKEFHNSPKLLSLLKVIPSDELVLVNSFNNSQRTLTALPGPYLQAIQMPKTFQIKFKNELNFAPPLSPSSPYPGEYSSPRKLPTSTTPVRSSLKGARKKFNPNQQQQYSPETHNENSTERYSAGSRDYFSSSSSSVGESKRSSNYDPPSSKHGNHSPDADRMNLFAAESKSKASNSTPAAATGGSNQRSGGDPSLLFRESKNGIIDYEDFLRYRASTASLTGSGTGATAAGAGAGDFHSNRYPATAASPATYLQHSQQHSQQQPPPRSPNKPYDEGNLNHHRVAKAAALASADNAADSLSNTNGNGNGNSNGATNSTKLKFNDDFDALLERSEAFVNDLNNQRKSSTLTSSNMEDSRQQQQQQQQQSRRSSVQQSMSQSAPLSAAEQRLQSLVKRIEDSKTPHYLAGLPVPSSAPAQQRASNSSDRTHNPLLSSNTYNSRQQQQSADSRYDDIGDLGLGSTKPAAVNGWMTDHGSNKGTRVTDSGSGSGSKSALARSMSSLEMMQQQGFVKARHDLLGNNVNDASFNLNTSTRQQQPQHYQQQSQSSQRKLWMDSNLAELVSAQQGIGRNAAPPPSSPKGGSSGSGSSIHNTAPKVYRHGSPMLGRSSNSNNNSNSHMNNNNSSSKVRASTSSLGSNDNNSFGSNDFRSPSTPFARKMNSLNNIYGTSNSSSTPGRATTPSAGMYRSASPSVRASASSLPIFPSDNKQRSSSTGAGAGGGGGGVNKSRNSSFNDLSSVGSGGGRASSSNLRETNANRGNRPGTPTRAWRF